MQTNKHLTGPGLLFSILLSATICFGDALRDWTWRNPLPQGGDLYAVAYANGIFIAGGTRALTSLDTTNWAVSGLMSQMHSVVYANSIYVATTSGSILTSQDGTNWITRISGVGGRWNASAYGNGTHVAVGGSGTQQAIFTSPDGLSWSQVVLGAGFPLKGIAFGNGTFVAVGASGTIMTSSNGVVWESRVSGTPDAFNSATYGNGTFVAVGSRDSYAGIIATSPDGTNWTLRSDTHTIGPFNSVLYANGAFLAVGGSPANGGMVSTSPDGLTWDSRKVGGPSMNAVTFGNDRFVAVGADGAILVSNDATNWVNQQRRIYIQAQDITFGANTFAAVGTGPNILTSSNGAAWVVRLSSTNYLLRGVTYGGEKFVAVGEDRSAGSGGTLCAFCQSPDAVTWTVSTNRLSTSTLTLNTVA